MKRDTELRVWAAEHRGVFRTADARRLGLTPRMLTSRRHAGEIERVEPGVWRFVAAPRTWEQRVLAGAWSERGWAGFRTGAALWRFDGCRPGIVEVLVERWRRRPNPSIRVHETLSLHEDDRTELDGIPITSPARTAVDLGAVLPADRVERAVDSIWQRRLATPEELWACIERLDTPGRPWVHVAKRAVASRAGVVLAPNRFESLLAELVRRAGLPDPQPQAVLSDADGVIGRVDWLVPSFRLVLECDSFEWHGAWHRRKADLRRDRRLVAAGYLVLRFSWEDVTRRQQQVLADLVGAASRLAA
jgi:hypothetical protein